MIVVPAAFGGCTPPQDLRVAMEAYAPAQRISAVKTVAARGELRQVPGLVDRLDDEDVAVRLAAIIALEQLTGERFGFDAWGAPEARIASVNVWRAYVAEAAGRGWSQPGGTGGKVVQPAR